MPKSNASIQVRLEVKEAMEDLVSFHKHNRIDLYSYILSGFMLLPEGERREILEKGTKASLLLQAGIKYNLEKGFALDESELGNGKREQKET